MKIYKLSVSQVKEPDGPILSSYISPRQLLKTEYFVSDSKAWVRKAEILNSLQALVGYIPSFEVEIKEIEVIE